jgi:hypothetical protein
MQNKVAGAEMQFARYLAAVECPALKSAYFVMIHYQTWLPQAILVSYWLISKKSYPLKPLGQVNQNLVGSILGRSFLKIANLIPIC